MVSDIKDKILDAAVQLLVEQGPNALTQPKIAAAAGVRQSHLTYYFPKRNDLLMAITLHWGKSHMEAAAASLDPTAVTPGDITQFIADRVIDAGRVRIILSLMVASEEDPRIKESLSEFIEIERQSTGTLLSVIGLPSDARLRALVHATLVGFSVLNMARGPRVERESRELTAYWLERVVPMLAADLQSATASAETSATATVKTSKAQAPATRSTKPKTTKPEATKPKTTQTKQATAASKKTAVSRSSTENKATKTTRSKNSK